MSPPRPQTVTLVTGAAGKTGRAVIRSLNLEDLRVRALVRNPRQGNVVKTLGADQVIAGDLGDDEVVAAAMRGVESVYHICPNVHPDETDIGRRVIAAARETGIERFVFHSVLHPQTQAMPHHWAKLRVEELLLESGLSFTILQPAPYMQNLLGQWERIVTQGVFSVPYALTARVAMVDLDDVASVAPRVLEEAGHEGATYELCGPDLLDQEEIASLLGRHLGRQVRAERLSLEAWARESGYASGTYEFDTLVKMFRYYERHGMAGNSRALAGLLDRPPAGLQEVLGRTTSTDTRL